MKNWLLGALVVACLLYTSATWIALHEWLGMLAGA